MICKALALSLLFVASVANSSEVRLSLLEKKTSTTTAYSIELSPLSFRAIEAASGAELPQLGKYVLKDRKLVADTVQLTEADEILYQCRIDGLDLVVVRIEDNSFSSPMKILSALSGHPVQMSTIVALAIGNGRVVSEKEITHKDSSYHWVVKVLK